MSTQEKTKKKDRNTAATVGPKQVKYIALYDIRSGPDKNCAICGDEIAVLEMELKSAYHNKTLSFLVGPACRTGIEAGLREHRKWTVRGGAYITKEKKK